MLLTVNQLNNIKNCPFKAYVNSLGFKTQANKNSNINQVYKYIIYNYDLFKLSDSQITQLINEQLEDKHFLTKQEKELCVSVIKTNLLKLIHHMHFFNKREIVTKDYSYNIELDDEHKVNVKCDLIVKRNNELEVIKFKSSKPELSYKARKQENLPTNNIELYLLYKLGENYKNQNNVECNSIKASFYHLNGKNDNDYYKMIVNGERDKVLYELNQCKIKELDLKNLSDKESQKELKEVQKKIKSILDNLYFENSEGINIISLTEINSSLKNNIIELMDTKLDDNSPKCNSSKCDMCQYKLLCSYHIDDKKPDVINIIEGKQNDIKLTEAQQRVVNFNKGIMRVSATAGSGKTACMVMRYLELVKNGVKPQEILMITFTEKGATEIKDRIIKLSKHYNIKIDKNDIKVYTFNSFGMDVINQYYTSEGLPNLFQLATNVDVLDIIKDMVNENDKIDWLNYKDPLMNFPYYKGCLIQLNNIFDIIKSYGLEKSYEVALQRYLLKSNVEYDEYIETIRKLYEDFNIKLSEDSLLQYQDQILYAIDILKCNQNVIEYLNFKHIVVDEYQDTDYKQIEIIHLLLQYSGFQSLCVVGDPDQSIYAFRNTTSENIINFDKQFENVQDEFLLDNFRSTPQICNLANKFIKQNEFRIDKDIISKKENGESVDLIGFNYKENESNFIVDTIEAYVNNGTPMTNICVINRKKKALLELKKLLSEKNIPSVLEVSERYIDNDNVKTILNLANFFRNPEQNTYYFYEYFKNVNKENKSKETVDEAISNITEILNENHENKEELYTSLFYQYAEICTTDDVSKSFISKLKERNFYTFYELLSYLNKITLYNDDTAIDKDKSKYNAITLTTAHSSKGKEWNIVICPLDDYSNPDNTDELEQERNLCFVSITRAMDKLILTYTDNKSKHNRFAEEICECLEK